jgi:tetratricopeptide (TPR) repeat protein
VVLTIRICKLLGSAALALIAASPSFAATDTSSDLDRYVDARLAEIGNRDDTALKGYLNLFKKQADSEVLADRLFVAAVREGDMLSALRAVRAQELRNQISSEAPLLLFADAFRRKNWTMANVAASELAAKSNFGFLAPILKEWVSAAQGNAAKLQAPDPKVDPYFAYFSIDQRVYLDLASGNLPQARAGFSALAGLDDDFSRDLAISAAPVFAANNDRVTAATLLQSSVERDYGEALVKTSKGDPAAKMLPETALAALHIRVARTLIEQNNGEKALVFARVAAWLAPSSDPAKLLLAQVLDNQGLPDRALTVLKDVAPVSPYWPRAVSDQVRLLLKTKQPAQALSLAVSAYKVRPNSGNLSLVAAQTYEETGDLKSAALAYSNLVSEADKARANPQQRAIYRLFLATVLDKMNDWPSARKILEEAKGIDPKNSFILNYLGYTMLDKREDVQLGLEYVRAAFKISPESAAIADSLGWGYFLTGDYERSVPLLEIAVKTSGNDMTMNEHLGDAYWLSGRFIDARYAWRIASQNATETDLTRLSGKIDLGLDKAVTAK